MSIRVTAALLIVVVATAAAPGQTPLGTEFTYQGRLANAGSPANGLHDMRFQLYDASSLGAAVGSVVCTDNVSVTDGLFTVPLDFGAQSHGQERFLEIEVRVDTGLDCANPTGFDILAPRQALTAAPNALFALKASTAGSATTATNAIQLNGQLAFFYLNASNLNSGTLPDARLSANIPRLNAANDFGNFTNTFFGNVGVGTETPGGKLHVQEGSAGAIAPHSNSSTVLERSGNNYLQMYAPDANESGLLFGNATQDIRAAFLADANNSLQFRSGGNSTRMTLDAAGNLGIGTSSPSAPLDILDSNGRIRISSTLNPSEGSVLELRNTTIGNTATGAVNFIDAAGAMEGQMSYGANGLSLSTSGALRMRVDLSGNVGIGTATPTGKLHVIAPSGDTSVVLPSSSISAAESADEPGIANDINPTASSTTLVENVETVIATRTITCPKDGYVLAIATGGFSTSENTTKTVAIGVSTTTALPPIEHREAVNLVNGFSGNVDAHRVFTVTAGAHTYRLIALALDDNVSTFANKLTLVYLPTAYGVVED